MMNDRWRDFFDSHGAFDRGGLATSVQHWGFHETLYGMIARHCPRPASILDIGSGTGWSDCYLASLGYEVTGLDNIPALVDFAKGQADLFGVPAKFEIADAFELSNYYSRFDLVMSCGVLEHFDHEITIKLLKEQAKCAPMVLIQVPTSYTRYTGQITDERIYTINELAEIVENAGLSVISKFGYGELAVTPAQKIYRQILPRIIWRWLQNKGYAYGIAVIGKRN